MRAVQQWRTSAPIHNQNDRDVRLTGLQRYYLSQTSPNTTNYHSTCLLDLFNQHRYYMERNEKQAMREYDFLEGVPLLAIFPNPLS